MSVLRDPVEISVVIPAYGCREALRALHERTATALRNLGCTYEIVLVDDCDDEGSWDVAAELARADTAVKAYRLSRNFGQHAAITAGLAQCTGRWAVVMDCDLQDPPENIPDLYRKALEGNDVVLARRKMKRHSFFRRVASRIYFRLMNSLATARLDGEFGSFSIISRKVIDAFLRFQDRDRHYLFILNWLGFRTAAIEYEHADRHSGGSSYTFRHLVRHAIDGMFFQTTVLLRWIVYVGFWISLAGFLLAAYYLYMYLVHSVYPGFTSLAVLILVIGGFIIMSTGVAGLYIGKVFDQVKGRPLYVIDQAIVDGRPQ
jgi:polyisoprenyl-phosphate glycosyltransferase